MVRHWKAFKVTRKIFRNPGEILIKSIKKSIARNFDFLETWRNEIWLKISTGCFDRAHQCNSKKKCWGHGSCFFVETQRSQAVFIDVCSLTEFSHKNYFGLMMFAFTVLWKDLSFWSPLFFSHKSFLHGETKMGKKTVIICRHCICKCIAILMDLLITSGCQKKTILFESDCI